MISMHPEVVLGLLVQAIGQPGLQPLAGTGQARHDRPERQVSDVGDLLILQPFQFAQDHHFSILHRQSFQHLAEELLVGPL